MVSTARGETKQRKAASKVEVHSTHYNDKGDAIRQRKHAAEAIELRLIMRVGGHDGNCTTQVAVQLQSRSELP